MLKAVAAAVLAFALPLPVTSGPAERFLTRPDAPLTSYRATRHLKAGNEGRHMSAWLDAVTELDPQSGFTYRIVSEGGSDFIRSHVLRSALEREKRAFDSDERRSAALTPDNYRFGLATLDEHGLFVVPIVPRHRGELLIDGAIVIDGDGDLLRIEGRVTKTPSFWTRRVDIVRRYGRINGVRVMMDFSSIAHVLVIGASTFSMCADYESVNGMAVEPRTSCS